TTAIRFWIDIRVPVGTPPGVYSGQATFAAEGVPAATLPVRVRVLPFSLPEPVDRFFGEYYQGPRLANGPEEERAFLERDMRDMRANGMTSVGLCFGIPTEAAVFADGKAQLNLPADSQFVHFMDLYRDLGFPAPVVMLSDSGQSFAAKGEVSFGSPEYKERYQAFWRAMQEECRTRRWPELIVQPVDEPGWKDQEAKDRNATLLRWLKEIPGMRTEQDGPGDDYFRNVAGPHADMWNYNGAVGKEAEVAAAKAEGHLIAIYNCDVESYRPEAQRYVAGFYLQRAGIHGCYNWAYMSFSGSPYSDFDFRTGTWMHVYPAWKDEVGGPSIGWLGFREGIDDCRYLLAFEQAAAEAERAGTVAARQAAAEGRRQIAALLATIDYSPAVRNAPRFAGKRATEHGFEVTGPLKIANGWDFATYDLARWQVAQAVLRILAPEPQPVSAGVQPANLLDHPLWSERAARQEAPRIVARQVSIPLLDSAPTVDGDLTETVWAQASQIGDFSLVGGGAPQAQTRAWLYRTASELCIGVECEEPFTSMLTAGIAEDGGEVWKDDCIELFLDPKLDRSTFRQLVVNSLGKVLAVDSTGAKWQPKVRVATRVLADRWLVELVLPLADVQATSTSFGLNLCRERRPTEVFELSCWSPTGGRFGEPSRFGVASLGASFLPSVALGPGVLGPNTLEATVGNPTAAALPVRLVVLARQGDEEGRRSESAVVNLAPGATASVAVPYELGGQPGPVTVQTILKDDRTGTVLAEQRLNQTLAPPLTVRVSPAVSFASRETLACTVNLAVAPVLLPKLTLSFELLDGADGRIVARRQLPVAGEVLHGELRLASAPGSYNLRTILTGDGGAVLGQAETPLTRVVGPF
ncbi:MAG: sugar-binding protein, partial [Lentisphaeria bacterium]|nr:sugar-binding protein [Lentisphaeria bacterium]